MEQHGVHPAIDDTVYGFADIATAIRRLPEGEHFGKVCIAFN